jgi:hypothetical protein
MSDAIEVRDIGELQVGSVLTAGSSGTTIQHVRVVSATCHQSPCLRERTHMARLTRRALLLTITIAVGSCRAVPQSATVTLTVAGMV